MTCPTKPGPGSACALRGDKGMGIKLAVAATSTARRFKAARWDELECELVRRGWGLAEDMHIDSELAKPGGFETH